MLKMEGSDGFWVVMKGMRSGLFICLGCRVCMRGMSAARCICLVTKSRLLPRFRRYVVSSVVRILNVSSVEQIRRRRSARLKGMAFLCVEDDKRN